MIQLAYNNLLHTREAKISSFKAIIKLHGPYQALIKLHMSKYGSIINYT